MFTSFTKSISMEELWVYILSSTFFLILLLFSYHFLRKQTQNKNLPPTPPSLPIIGHLHLIKEPLHRTLQHLSNQYGPIFSLKFGSRFVLVLSSSSIVEECFTKNDIVFANRPHLIFGKYLNYDYTTLGTSNYGDHWRNLRRLTTLEIFSRNRLNKFQSIRKDEVRLLVKNIYQITQQNYAKVEMKSRLSEMSFNIITRMMARKKYLGNDVDDYEEARRFEGIIREIFELSGSSYLGDFIPFLQWIDFQGMEKKLLKMKTKIDTFLQGLIEESRNNIIDLRKFEDKKKSMIDVMLNLQEENPEYYSDDIIKGIILSLLSAGTDTSSVTIEWAMSLLLNHPTVLNKAKAEIHKHIGVDHLVEESDLSKLHYLQSIIKETYRLFPAAPLLLPHESSDDCIIGGYNVPKGSMLFVNAWAIHRDSNIWEDATTFRPERFERLEGEAYKLIPFGLGRRRCPGEALANKVVGLALATLIQCFEWERVSEEEINMMEGTGLTMPKDKPLEALCKASESMISVLLRL